MIRDDDTARTPQAGLVGRDDELRVVRSRIEALGEDEGGTVLITGEAGMGKSHLARALVAEAEEADWPVVIGHPDPVLRDRSFGILIDALGPPALPDTPRAPGETVVDPYAAGDHYLDLVQRLCRDKQMLLVAEDLHWADDASLATLARLVRLADQLPLLLVATSRPGPRPEAVDRLHRLVADSAGAVVDLPPLALPDVARLAAVQLGAQPGPLLVERLGAAGGNPLYALELLRALDEAGSLERSGSLVELVGDAPTPSLPLTLLSGLRLLTRPQLDQLRMGSILGPTFSPEDLQAVSGTPMPEVITTLREASSASLLVEEGSRFRFRHDLVWELLYHDLTEPVRRAFHRTAASTLAAAGRPADEVASHLLRGTHSGDPHLLALMLSTAQALEASAPGLSLELADTALRAADDSDPVVPALLAERALALLATGQQEAGRDAIHAAVAASDDSERRARLRIALMGSLTTAGQPQDAIRVCQEALEDSSVSAAEEVRLRSSLAFALLNLGRVDEAVDHCERAVGGAAALDDPAALAGALVTRAHILSHMGRFTESAEVALHATRASSHDELHLAHVTAASRLAILDRDDESRAVLEEGRRLYERRGSAVALAQYHVVAGSRHLDRGDWDDAIAEFEATEGLTRDGLAWPVLSHGSLALIAAHRGTVTEAQEHIDAAMSALSQGAAPLQLDRVLRAQLVLAEADEELAAEPVEELVRAAWSAVTATSATVSSPGAAPALCLRFAAVGDDDLLQEAASVMSTCAELNPGATTIAATATLAAGLAHRDPERLLKAEQALRSVRRPLQQAIACEAAASVLHQSAGPEASAPLLSRARRIYARLGAALDVRRLEAATPSGLATTDRRAAPAVEGWQSLTATERTVAEHLGARLSNPEIAEVMFISRRTVESHVSRILAKLGLRSRREVARVWEQR